MEKPRRPRPTLAELQAWLADAIARPLPAAYEGNPLAVSAPGLAEAAAETIRTRGGLSGFGRVGVYNQQYWFRLITIMQEEYPCAVHVIGLRAFNDCAARFLSAHPPASPYLALLDAEFPGWLEANYRDENRQAALQAAAYDRAWSKAVDAPAGVPLAGVEPRDLLALSLCLPAHATPLALDWDFPAYRVECLADESLEANLVLAPREACLMVYRAEDGLREEDLSRSAFRILRELRLPVRLQEVFARMEADLDPSEEQELEANLTGWFKAWVEKGWLCREAEGEAA